MLNSRRGLDLAALAWYTGCARELEVSLAKGGGQRMGGILSLIAEVKSSP